MARRARGLSFTPLNPTPTFRSRELLSWTLCLSLVGCAGQAGHGQHVGRVKCDTIDYETRSLSARVKVPQQVGVEIESSKQAIRDVDEWVEKYFATWSTACMDYKNGALTREEYRDETQRIRQRMERLEELVVRLENAGTPQEFQAALRDTWTAAAPQGEAADLQLEMRVMAKRPGEADYSVTPPGATLPTGSEVFMLVQLNEAAHVQLYQLNTFGEQSVLFPSPAITLQNPLPGRQEVRIPSNGVFRLDDKDLGIEDVHLVAASQPLPSIAEATAPSQDAGLSECGTRGLQFVPDKCPRTRGLTFEPDSGGNGAGFSVKGANAARESGVHLVYSFHHVGDPETYGKKCPGGPGAKCRGLEAMRSMLGQRPPTMPGNFNDCPEGAAIKEMPGPEGSYERWCVEENARRQLVDHGPYRKWYASGKLWVQGQLDMGHRVGTWMTFDSAGNKLAEVTY